jgi:hypothetical protein
MMNSKSCNSDGTYPGKAYFGNSVNGINIEAGSRVEASESIYLIHEVSASDNEHNLMGFDVPSPLVTIQYMGSSIGETALNTIEFIVTASPSIGNEDKVQTVEFSLDGDNWLEGQYIDNEGVYQVNFGYLTAGNYTLFSKVNTVEQQQEELIVENESPVAEYGNGYYFLNSNWIGESINILGLLDNTSVTIAGSSYALNAGETISHTITIQGEIVKADKAFTVASEADGIDLPAPFSFLGTQFVIPNLRYNHTYFLLSPEVDAQVHIDIGTTSHDINLVVGQVYEFNAGSDEKVAGRIRSNQGIVVTHSGDVTDDVYPVPPATKSLWGIRSNYAYVSALEDNTLVTVYSSSGTSTSFILGATEVKEITIGSSTTQGQGDALHLVADKPIAAVQHADSDGIETTGFWSSSYFSTDYTMPVDSQYVSIVCNTADTVITLYDAEGFMMNSKSCNSDGTYPGKVYFGSSVNGINIEAGSRVEASESIYLIHEVSASDNEHNLMGIPMPLL